MDTKTCTKCGETKPLDEYLPDKRRGGRVARCHECRREAARRASRRRYEANREAEVQRHREWRDANREAIARQSREYREANREAVTARHKAWREANPEKARDYRQNYYEANRDRLLDAARQWASDNPHRVWVRSYRQRCRSYGVEPVIEDFTKDDVIERYGDSCAYCEVGAFENLDHFIAIKAGGHHTLSNVRPACFSCNRAKSDLDPDEWLADATRGEA